MNRTELCAALAKKTRFSKKDAETFTEALMETIIETLQQGGKVQIVGFGTFEVKERAARKARNPRTGEEIDVAASKAPVFKAGKVLKESVQ
jgi:DNA-binding protein HU-beta